MHIVYLPCPALPSLSCTFLVRVPAYPAPLSKASADNRWVRGSHCWEHTKKMQAKAQVQLQVQVQVHSGMILPYTSFTRRGCCLAKRSSFPSSQHARVGETRGRAGWPPGWPFTRTTAVLPECQNLVP